MCLPQYFKGEQSLRQPLVKFINRETARQYQLEERTLMARRVRPRFRVASLLDVMIRDEISLKVRRSGSCAEEMAHHYHRPQFNKSKSMGDISGS